MPNNAPHRAELLGTWWRVPELDTPGRRVFVRDGAPVPPARGRDGMALHDDGSATLLRPGATDRRQGHASRWHLDAQGVLRVEGWADASAPIAELGADVLAVQGP